MQSPYVDIPTDIAPVNPVGDNFITMSDTRVQALADIGDELRVTTGGNRRYTILDVKNLYVTPPLPAGTVEVELCKKGQRSGPLCLDHLDFDPLDPITVGLKETTTDAAVCTSGSRDVTLRSWEGAGPHVVLDPSVVGVKPGDLLVLYNGGNSLVDIGYGPGIYPIVEVTALVVKTSLALTSNDDSSWAVIRSR